MKLIIDTTESKNSQITLAEAGQTLDHLEGESLLVLIQKLLKQKKLRLADVELEFTNKPGSYTSLKVGASIVNALNFVQGNDQIIIPTY